jgi:RNase P subunit RPR2
MDEDAVALRLGRLVLACARVELQAGLLAQDFSHDDAIRNGHADKQVKAIRRGSRYRADASDYTAWARAADALLRERGRLVHGSFMPILEGRDERQGFVAHRDFSEQSVELSRLDALIERAQALDVQGYELGKRLMDGWVERLHEWMNPDLPEEVASKKCPNCLTSMIMRGDAVQWECPHCGLIAVL